MSLTRSVIQPPFDIDAQRFIYATGVTSFNIKRAITYLVQNMKANNLWVKCQAIYPMVGGNPWSCKFNLINPRDSDLAFRLSFVANPTFSYQGVDWNGSTQYANTFVTPSTSTIILQDSCHFSYYSRENVQESSFVVGSTDGTNNRYSYLALRQAGTGNTNVDVNSASSSATTVVNSDSRGFYIASRVNATQCLAVKNGVSTTGSNNSVGLSTIPFLIAARNVGATPGSVSASGFSTQQCAFASIGSGLTTTDCFNFYNIVQQFQIILGRQV